MCTFVQNKGLIMEAVLSRDQIILHYVIALRKMADSGEAEVPVSPSTLSIGEAEFQRLQVCNVEIMYCAICRQ